MSACGPYPTCPELSSVSISRIPRTEPSWGLTDNQGVRQTGSTPPRSIWETFSWVTSSRSATMAWVRSSLRRSSPSIAALCSSTFARRAGVGVDLLAQLVEAFEALYALGSGHGIAPSSRRSRGVLKLLVVRVKAYGHDWLDHIVDSRSTRSYANERGIWPEIARGGTQVSIASIISRRSGSARRLP